MNAVPNPDMFALPEKWRQLVELGFSVFPVERAGKKPLVPWKAYQTVRADLSTVRGWSQRDCNIGIATGAISGAIVLDLDTADAVREAEALGIPATLSVKTGKGLHVYFRHPGGTIGNRTGLRPGWDIRGDGGYVVAPGSLHPSGAVYAWDNPPGLFDLADAPAWLADMLAKSEHTPDAPKSSQVGADDTPYGLKALDSEVQTIQRAGNGEQETTLNAAALKIGALVAGKELSPETAKNRLIAAGLSMPSYDPGNKWTLDAIASKVERGLADGAAHPRSAPEQNRSNVVYPEPPAWMNEIPPYDEADGEQAFDYAGPEWGEQAAAGDDADILPSLDLAALARTRAKARVFAIERIAPLGEVTMLVGPGSGGKSLLAQQLATVAAAGIGQCLGLSVMETPAVYLTCEDDADELHWRQERLCEALRVPMADLAGKLHLVSLRGELGNELSAFQSDGKMVPTDAFTRLSRTIRQTGAKLALLDNVAHLFTGNENDRADVTRFVNLLNRLAGETGAAIILLGHPNKAGDEWSGSTAWNNAVRSRLYLEHDEETDLRTLSLPKANYSKKGDVVSFRWIDWAFVRDEDLPDDKRAEIADIVKANGENAAFLACLRERASQGEGRQVGPSPGPNYAPAQFETMAAAKGYKKAALRRAMDRLFSTGAIKAETYHNKAKGRDVTVIVEASPASPNAFPNASRTLFPNTPEPAPERPRAHSLYTTYIPGAGPDGLPAPDDDLDWSDGLEADE